MELHRQISYQRAGGSGWVPAHSRISDTSALVAACWTPSGNSKAFRLPPSWHSMQANCVATTSAQWPEYHIRAILLLARNESKDIFTDYFAGHTRSWRMHAKQRPYRPLIRRMGYDRDDRRRCRESVPRRCVHIHGLQSGVVRFDYHYAHNSRTERYGSWVETDNNVTFNFTHSDDNTTAGTGHYAAPRLARPATKNKNRR